MAGEPTFNDGEAYERSMGRWSRRVGVSFLDWVAPAPGLDWLDIGCGNGAFTETLVERCAPRSVAAIDPLLGQISYAQAHRNDFPIDYRIGDAQAMPCSNAQFDATTMALVIAFVPDPQKAVNEMARVTRPGGSVATLSELWRVSLVSFLVKPRCCHARRLKEASVARIDESRLFRGRGCPGRHRPRASGRQVSFYNANAGDA